MLITAILHTHQKKRTLKNIYISPNIATVKFWKGYILYKVIEHEKCPWRCKLIFLKFISNVKNIFEAPENTVMK